MVVAISSMLAAAVLLMLLTGTTAPGGRRLLVYRRAGGIGGLSEKVELFEDGRAVYTDERGGKTFEKNLPAEIPELIREYVPILEKFAGKSFGPKEGAADFFEYQVEVSSGGVFKIAWVDGWASASPLPRELEEFGRVMGMVVQAYMFEDSSWRNSAGGRHGGLRLTLELDKFFYGRGEQLEARALIENRGEAVTYFTPTPCHPDVEIFLEQAEGWEAVYVKPKFSKETVCIQVIDRRTLEVNGAIENVANISLEKVEPGLHRVCARFPYTFQKHIIQVCVPFYLKEG